MPSNLERTEKRGVRSVVLLIGPWVGLVVAWQLLSIALGRDAAGYTLLPGPVDLVASAPLLANYWPGWFGPGATREGAPITLEGAILGGALSTLATASRVFCGYILGVVAGIIVAVVLAWSQVTVRAMAIPTHAVRMLPLLGMMPLFSFWFGASYIGAVLFVALACFVVVFPVATAAIGQVPPYRTHYAAAMGATRLQTYFKVVIPAVLPRLKGPCLLAVGFAWSAVIAAELLGSDVGLGAIVVQSLNYGQSGLLGLSALIATLAAMVSYLVVLQVTGWILRWNE